MLVVLGFQIVLNHKYLNHFVILSSINILQDVRCTQLVWAVLVSRPVCHLGQWENFIGGNKSLFVWVIANKPVLSHNNSTRQRGGNVLEDRDGEGLQKPGFGPAVAVEEFCSSGFFVVLQKTPRASRKKSYLCPSPKRAVTHCDHCKPRSFAYLPANPPALQLNILFLGEATWTGEENEVILISAAC